MVKLTNSNDLKALIGKSQPNMSTQELTSQSSGELKTQESEIQVSFFNNIFIFIVELIMLLFV